MAARAKWDDWKKRQTAFPDPSDFSDDEREKVKRAREWGITVAREAMQVSVVTTMPFYILCAYLKQESGGGANVWGSDSTWMRGVELQWLGLRQVEEETYLVYKLHRGRPGSDDPGDHKFGMQGVGPMQLTHWTIQDRADQNGGCWKILPNILTGAELIMSFRNDGKTWHECAVRYNGSEAYGDHNDELRAEARDAIVKGDG